MYQIPPTFSVVMRLVVRGYVHVMQFSEEHSHGSLVALAIAIIAIFAAVNFNKVCTLYMCYLRLRYSVSSLIFMRPLVLSL